MPTARVLLLPQVPLHVIQRGNNRQICFVTDDDRRFYLEWLGEYAELVRIFGVSKRSGCPLGSLQVPIRKPVWPRSAQFTREPDEDPKGRSAFDTVAYRAHLVEAVIAAQPVTDADRAALGQARATAVRDRLLADTPEGPQEGRGRARAGPAGGESRAVESESDGQVVMEVGLAVD